MQPAWQSANECQPWYPGNTYTLPLFCSVTPPGMDTMHFVSYEIEDVQREANE